MNNLKTHNSSLWKGILITALLALVTSCTNLEAADQPNSKKPAAKTAANNTKKQEGKTLRTIQDGISGEKKNQAIGDGSVYAFKSLIGKKVKWQPADLTQGVWMPAGDTLYWLSPMSSFNATDSNPCPSGSNESGGGGGCPKGQECNPGPRDYTGDTSPISLTFTNESTEEEFYEGSQVNLSVSSGDEDSWIAECQNPESQSPPDTGSESDPVSVSYTCTPSDAGTFSTSSARASRSSLSGNGSVIFTVAENLTVSGTVTLTATANNSEDDKFPDSEVVQIIQIQAKKAEWDVKLGGKLIAPDSDNKIGLSPSSGSSCPEQKKEIKVKFASEALAKTATFNEAGGDAGLLMGPATRSGDEWTFDLEGLTATAAGAGGAKYTSNLKITAGGKTKTYNFCIVKPATLINLPAGVSGAVTMTYRTLNKSTSPPLDDTIAAGGKVCACVYAHNLEIEVGDQFGEPLIPSFQGAGVEEKVAVQSSTPAYTVAKPMNVTLGGTNAKCTYIDGAGIVQRLMIAHPTTGLPVPVGIPSTVPELGPTPVPGSMEEQWLVTHTPLQAGIPTSVPLTTQRFDWYIKVVVGGFELRDIIERTTKSTPPLTVDVTQTIK
ncbi:MAG: hypothetical protein ACAI35_26585 [Candidatus Methylacidiphilales bacterium]|nr:hypothetical protein [Candidatus Methylacidiphilales bacterium]